MSLQEGNLEELYCRLCRTEKEEAAGLLRVASVILALSDASLHLDGSPLDVQLGLVHYYKLEEANGFRKDGG